MPPKNPYIAGNPVGSSPTFVGRHEILQKVQDIVCSSSENTIVLYGQRRMGKTSILQKLEIELPKTGVYYPIFFDLLDKSQWNYSRLLQELADKISYTLGLGQANLDLVTNEPQTTFEQWVLHLLNQLPANASLVLLFDEFDVLAGPESEHESTDFFLFLRRLLDRDKTRLNAIFVIGRHPEDLRSAALPLVETNQQPVSFLNEQETHQIISLSNIRWTKEAKAKIWQLTSGHPFLTQRLCSDIWNAVSESQQNSSLPELTVTADDVDSAIPKTLDASDNIFEWLWNSLPPAERVVAFALSKEQSMTEKQLEAQLSQAGVLIVIRELEQAPHRLIKKELIGEVEKNHFHFRVELWRIWIANNKSLNLIQDDLDRVQPMADHIYQLAIRNYHHKHLDEASANLYRVMRYDPEHLGAHRLLARIEFKNGKLEKAYETLERLHDKGDDNSRPLLIEVLLALGNSAKNEEDKLKNYQQVLDLEPNNDKAKEEIQTIWQQRGEKAYRENQLEEAKKCYVKANLDGKFNQKIADIQTDIDKQKQLNKWYQQGIGALQEGDTQTAQNKFQAVIEHDLTYKEALRYLYQLVTGIDIKKLKRKLKWLTWAAVGMIILLLAGGSYVYHLNQRLETKLTELSNIFDNINNYKRFIALVRKDIKPFSYQKEEKWVGFEIDLLREFARRWFPNHKDGVIFRPIKIEHYRDNLMDSNNHIVTGTLSQKQSPKLDYSLAYFEYDKGLLVRKNDDIIKDFCKIRGEKIAIVQDSIKKEDSITKKRLEQARKKKQCLFPKFISDNIEWANSYSEAFKYLQQGTVKAIAGDRIRLKELLKETSNYEVSNIPSQIAELYHFGVPNQYQEKWLQLIDYTLNAMVKDNTYDRIYCKWFPDETPYAIVTYDSELNDKQLFDMARAEKPLSTDEFPECSQSMQSERDYPIEHIVKKGDTLWDLSKQYYGTFSHWEYIYKKNQGKPVLIGNSPDKLKTGKILRIPEPPPTPKEK